MMAGYAGYGLCGGGLGIYNLETQEATLVSHENLVPNQSTITLRALPDGNLVGGTSISAPGGGHTSAKEGVLYILDWPTRKVAFQTAPVPGASEVFAVEVGPDGLVYGLASGSKYFVFDPKIRKVVHTEDLSAYGALPRHPLILGPDKNIYAIFTKAVVRLEPGTFKNTKLADAPMGITAGLALVKGRLYFSSGSHLWSFDLKL
jgi:streptogramin lyase